MTQPTRVFSIWFAAPGENNARALQRAGSGRSKLPPLGSRDHVLHNNTCWSNPRDSRSPWPHGAKNIRNSSTSFPPCQHNEPEQRHPLLPLARLSLEMGHILRAAMPIGPLLTPEHVHPKRNTSTKPPCLPRQITACLGVGTIQFCLLTEFFR